MRFLFYFTSAALLVLLTWPFFGKKNEVKQIEVNEERLQPMPESAETSSVLEIASNAGLQRRKVVSIGSAALANREDLPRHAELAEVAGKTPVEAPTIDERNLVKDAQGNLVTKEFISIRTIHAA